MMAFRPAAALLLSLAAGHAAAETRMLEADQLAFTSTLRAHVSIVTDAALAHTVRVSADGALSCLSLSGREAAAIGTAECGSSLSHLVVAVSPDTPVTLVIESGGGVSVGDLRAKLTATLRGSGNLAAGAVRGLALAVNGSGDASVGPVDGPADLALTGHGDARLAAVNGPLTARLTGSGDLAVGQIQAKSADLGLSGSGDTLIGSGAVGLLHARLDGSGDLAVAATVGGGDVEATGGGDVKLGAVTGPLARSASGGSDIVVGGPAVVNGIVADLAAAIGEDDGTAREHGDSATRHGLSDFVHFLMAVVGAVTLFLIWRIVRRGGLASLRSRAQGAPQTPLHPGVVAIGDTLSRLEQRLGRIESYVTTREFELNRKFRDLG